MGPSLIASAVGSIDDPSIDHSTLLDMLERSDSLAIVCHDNPDPDCLASALGLEYIAASLGVEHIDVLYGGAITHQQNRAMVNVLDLDIDPFEADSIGEYESVGFVDHARPGRNNTVPSESEIDVVIDHHDVEPADAAYVDHRTEVGATATILTEYLREFEYEPDERLWTALLFGIRRETLAFQRGTTQSEYAAAQFLHPHVDTEVVRELSSTLFSTGTLNAIGKAISDREVRGSWLVSNAGRTTERDAIPQAADYLLNLEGVNTTIVFAVVDDSIQLSARSRDSRVHIGEWFEETLSDCGSAGGHQNMAGGRIGLDTFVSGDEIADEVVDLAARSLTRRLFTAIEEGS